jgi:hypothetical protein
MPAHVNRSIIVLVLAWAFTLLSGYVVLTHKR